MYMYTCVCIYIYIYIHVYIADTGSVAGRKHDPAVLGCSCSRELSIAACKLEP